MKEQILQLRSSGLTIDEISKQTGLSVTEVSTVIYEQNNIDKQEESPKARATREIVSLVRILYERAKNQEKVCIGCYLKKIADFINRI